MRGVVYVLGAVAIWSTAEVVIREIHEEIAPILLAWVRFTLGGLALLALLPSELRRKGLRLDGKILADSAIMSIPGIVIASIAYQYALIYAGANIVATIFGATPLIVFVMSYFILGDPFTLNRAVGVTLGFAGILILSSNRASSTFSLLGVGLTLANTVGFSLFTVLVKRNAREFAGLPVTVLSFLFASLFLLPFVLWENDYSAVAHWRMLLLPMAYISFGTTGFAYWLYFRGLEFIDATRAISYILIKPPLAALLAAWWLGEAITWRTLLSMVFILGGLYLVNAINKYHLYRQMKE